MVAPVRWEPASRVALLSLHEREGDLAARIRKGLMQQTEWRLTEFDDRVCAGDFDRDDGVDAFRAEFGLEVDGRRCLVEHLGDELRIEGARHLVEEQELGLHRERAHDRDVLSRVVPARCVQ
jgi:hypothetical protein